MRAIYRFVVPTLALLLAPVALAAQQPGAVDPTQLPPEAQEVIQEMQQIQAQLGPIQQQALQDPTVQTAGEELGERIQAAMAEVDPETPQRMERLQTLMTEAQSAQASQDESRLMEIMSEAQQIEMSLQAAQTEAIQQPGLAAEVEGFQTRVQEKMVEVNPEAGELLERFEELDSRLAMLLGDN